MANFDWNSGTQKKGGFYADEPLEKTPFQSTLKSTTAGMANAFAGQPLEDIGQAIGSKGLQGFGQNVRQQAEAVQQANPSAINSLSDAVAHPWDTVKTAAGNVLPQIPVSLASAATGARLGGMVGGLPGAAIGGLAGAFAPNYLQEYAEMRGKQREAGQENIPKALGYALPAAGLETAADVFGLGRVMPDAVKNSVIGKALGSDTLTGNRLAHVGKKAVKGIGAEAGTEYAQTGLEQIGGNQALDTEQAANERNVSALLGGIGGGVIRGGLSAFDQRNPLAGQWQAPGYEYKGEGIAGPQQRGDVIAGPNTPEAIDVSQVSRRGPGDVEPEQPFRQPQDEAWNNGDVNQYAYEGEFMPPVQYGINGYRNDAPIDAEYTVTPTGQPVPDSVKESAAQGGTLSTALLTGSQQVRTPARGLLGFNQPSDIQEAPEQPQESSFTPTHLLSDGTPVIPTDEPNIWFDGANEIEDDYAEPINATNTPRINAAIDTRTAGDNPATSGADRGTGNPVIAGDTGTTVRGIGGIGAGLQGQVPSDSQPGRALEDIELLKPIAKKIIELGFSYRPGIPKGEWRKQSSNNNRMSTKATESEVAIETGLNIKDIYNVSAFANRAYEEHINKEKAQDDKTRVNYARKLSDDELKQSYELLKNNDDETSLAVREEYSKRFGAERVKGRNLNQEIEQLNVQSQNTAPQETATEEAVETNAPFQIEIEADTNGGKKPDTQTILSEETMADSQIQGKSSKILPGNAEMSSQGNIGQNSEQGVSLAISGKDEGKATESVKQPWIDSKTDSEQWFGSRIEKIPDIKGEKPYQGTVRRVLKTSSGVVIEVQPDNSDSVYRLRPEQIKPLQIVDSKQKSPLEQSQEKPTQGAQKKPSTGYFNANAKNGSLDEQKRLAYRAGKLSVLHQLNEELGEYTRKEIDNIAENRIEPVKEYLIAKYNEKQPSIQPARPETPTVPQASLSTDADTTAMVDSANEANQAVQRAERVEVSSTKSKQINDLVKQATGPQVTNQPRAQAGGEIGPNGEFYKGGAFIATTDLPKKVKQKLAKKATGREQIEPGMGGDKWAEVPAGKLPVMRVMGGGTAVNPWTGEINYQYLEYSKHTPEQIKDIEALRDRWMQGERFVDVNEYPHLANIKDAARLAVNGLPLPVQLLDKFDDDTKNALLKTQSNNEQDKKQDITQPKSQREKAEQVGGEQAQKPKHKITEKQVFYFEQGMNVGAEAKALNSGYSASEYATKSGYFKDSERNAFIKGFELAQESDYETEWRGSKNLLSAAESRGEVEVRRKEKTQIDPERIGDIVPKTPAIHIEGKTQTKATPAEINDALKKASERKSWSKTQMREWLVGEIDKAIDGAKESGYAATEKTDEIVKLEEEASQIRNTIHADDLTEARTGTSGIGDYAKGNLKSRLSNIDYQIQDIKAKQVADSVGMVTFDVPGDGRFKVRNTKEALRSFKEKVLDSPGFKDTKRTTTSKPKAPAFSVSSMIADFLADGEYENAYYAAKEAGVRLGFGSYTGGADVNVYTDIEPVDLVKGRAMFVGRRLVKVEKANKTEVKSYWAVIDEKSGAAIAQANTKKEVLFEAEEAIKIQKDNGGDERLESVLKQAELRGANQEQLQEKFKEQYGIKDESEETQPEPQEKQIATEEKKQAYGKKLLDDIVNLPPYKSSTPSGQRQYEINLVKYLEKELNVSKDRIKAAIKRAIDKATRETTSPVMPMLQSHARQILQELNANGWIDEKLKSKEITEPQESLETIFKSLGKDKQVKASDINHPQAELIADVQNNWHRVLIEHGYIENKDGTFSDVGGKETEPKRILIKGKGCS